jgi:hypothetical protein
MIKTPAVKKNESHYASKVCQRISNYGTATCSYLKNYAQDYEVVRDWPLSYVLVVLSRRLLAF